jgi:membrane protein DedA with SNARE-associated domain
MLFLIPSEIIMPFSGFLVAAGKFGSVGMILAGSLGNLVGSIATYFLGIKLGRMFLIKYGNKYVSLNRIIWSLQRNCFINMERR